jgi:trehalose/maltose hydrolase-like predicted phosphorylase
MNFEGAEVIEKSDKGIFRNIKINAEPEVEYTIYKYVSVYTGNDEVSDIREDCTATALKAAAAGYGKAYNDHIRNWKARWEAADVIIEGDEKDQLALRYSIYQLQIIAPAHSQAQSIPARGLSGQTYKGAIFWDTEMFMLPFYLHTSPEIARNLISYRINTLEGARKKAAYYGYRGAFYAWESQENGEDACSDFNVTDVFTERPVRTYFRDKQIHISAAVAYAIWEFYKFTGDISILINGGAEAILECARFFYSYAYYKEEKDRYEILDVIGPDEYHERVNNNAYTNKMVYHTLDVALQALKLLESEYPEEYEELISKLDYSKEISNIIKFKEK